VILSLIYRFFGLDEEIVAIVDLVDLRILFVL